MNFVIVRYKSAFRLTVIVLFPREGHLALSQASSAYLAQEKKIKLEARFNVEQEIMPE